MPPKSVYLPNASFEQGTVVIAGDEHHHLSVARIQEGETLEVFDGRGGVWTAEVVGHSKRETRARLTGSRTVEPDPHEIILGLALVRTAAFELALEKVVEVGVTRIVPVIAARSNVVPGKRPARWARIAIEAAKQSKRYHLAEVEDACTFEAILQRPARSKVMFAERDGGPLRPTLTGSPVLYLVGPEGGWTAGEMEAARASGFAMAGLGAGVLKTETAAIVGAALIRYELQAT